MGGRKTERERERQGMSWVLLILFARIRGPGEDALKTRSLKLLNTTVGGVPTPGSRVATGEWLFL